MPTPENLRIGPYGQHERPEPLEATYYTVTGAVLDLTSFTDVWAEHRHPDGSWTTYTTEAAITEPGEGGVTLQWPDGSMDQEGEHKLFWWVESASMRLSSLPFLFEVVYRGYDGPGS